ncbi:hypothetical protein JHK82_025769 [Glycine max]|nr:hypothetical protein JHK82_025769 [Glycine max]
MADSSVSFLLDKLSSLLEAEVKLQRGVREDVQHIKYELEGYKGILRVADALEDKNPELKAWVKRVRDVAHDMEDAIDEFSLGLVDQHGQGNNSSFHMNFFTRHKIASNIQGIKSRLDIISQKRPDIPWIGSGSSQRLSSRLDSQGDALLLEEADLVDNSLENFSIRALCSTGYKLLRVLDLQDAPLEVFPAEIVSLYLLKYLSLKNTKVKSIPGSIKKLQQLETLDLKHTHVTVLPVEIVELQRLRHLLVYRYEIESYANLHSRHGFKVAAPIGLMQSLQKLCFIEADQALMIELGKLTRLRRLGIRKMRKQDGAALCSSIEKMINLRSLSITAIEEDEIIDIHNIFRPPQYLHQLYLSGRLDNFPHWIRLGREEKRRKGSLSMWKKWKKGKKQLVSSAPWRGEETEEESLKEGKLKVTRQGDGTSTMHVPASNSKHLHHHHHHGINIDPQLRYSFQRNFQILKVLQMPRNPWA